MSINEEAIRELMQQSIKGIDISKVRPEDKFSEVGIDSLDLASILMAVDEKYGIKIPDEDVDKCNSIHSIVNYCKELH